MHVFSVAVGALLASLCHVNTQHRSAAMAVKGRTAALKKDSGWQDISGAKAQRYFIDRRVHMYDMLCVGFQGVLCAVERRQRLLCEGQLSQHHNRRCHVRVHVRLAQTVRRLCMCDVQLVCVASGTPVCLLVVAVCHASRSGCATNRGARAALHVCFVVCCHAMAAGLNPSIWCSPSLVCCHTAYSCWGTSQCAGTLFFLGHPAEAVRVETSAVCLAAAELSTPCCLILCTHAGQSCC